MKRSLPLILALLAFLSGAAQTPASPPPFTTAINAVLSDFADNLRHITGELLLAQGEFENYASRVELPGSRNCMITRYHSAYDTTASWQAKMATRDDFNAAAREYHDLYLKLETCTLQLADGTILYLKGKWEPAREGLAFTTSNLRLTTGYGPYRHLNVELELVYELDAWSVNINIFSKEREGEPVITGTIPGTH